MFKFIMLNFSLWEFIYCPIRLLVVRKPICDFFPYIRSRVSLWSVFFLSNVSANWRACVSHSPYWRCSCPQRPLVSLQCGLVGRGALLFAAVEQGPSLPVCRRPFLLPLSALPAGQGHGRRYDASHQRP